jgi:hypothetical protein
MSVRYFDLVREMKNAYNHRLRLVESARPTARHQTHGALICHHRAQHVTGSLREVPSTASRRFRFAGRSQLRVLWTCGSCSRSGSETDF